MKTKRKNIFKSLLALTLALIMVLGSAPLSALAGVDFASLFAPKAEATGKEYKVGDIISFGSYPQSRVTDSSTVSALDKISKNWVSYGYYSGDGTGGSMKQGDWMKYADITYNGAKYRAVTFSQYRPWYTSYKSSSDCTYQDDNGYTPNNIYYFKYEPLEWRVLDPKTGFVICKNIIDSQAYSNITYNYENENWNDAEHTHYANDYATSSIRKWLNDDFYNTAFSASQKANILTTELDNRAYSTSYSKYDSETTYDKVFLLSWSEMQNTAYGFPANIGTSSARQAKGTDYAKCQGLWVSSSNECSTQRLRSAGNYSDYTCYVNSYGFPNYYWGVDLTNYGVRPAIKISNLGSITNNTATYAPDSSEPATASSNSKSDTSRHFPRGYKFEEDSYNFSNYGDTISKKYFTTFYGAEKGKLLYKKYHKQGGLCFGMAYTTAAIYNGYPSCSKISTLDKGLFKYKYCENIRDILNEKVRRVVDPTMRKTVISSKLPIGENVIGIEDYIKYAFVYQFSKTVSDTSVWCGNANVILDLAKQYTDENKIGLTIGITGKDKGMEGHRVLVVGYEGNDILVDDPNKTSGWNRITVNPDGSWTFGNADNNSYYIRYNVDYQRPFELLKSGKTETADEEFLDNTAARETYVEDIDTLDKESKLLAVDSDSYDLDEKKFSAVYLESGEGQSVNAYWTDKTTASIKNINGGNRAVEFAGNGYIISAIVADSSDVDMTLNKNKFKTQVNSKKGSECTISVDACREDDSNNDISKKIEIVGTATDGEVTVERINKGIRVLGIENGTVNYYIDDNMVSTEKTDGNGDFFDIKYDAQGEDDTLQIKKVKFSKLRKFLKKIFKAIAKPFKALARYIKKLFSK